MSFVPLRVLLREERKSLLLLFLTAFVLRFYLGLWQHYPGTADFPAYLIVSKNLYQGKGFIEGYIGMFLYDFADVIHPSNQTWQPLPSIVHYIFFLLARSDSFRVAQFPSILIGSLLPSILFFFLRRWGFSMRAAFLSSAFVVLSPFFLIRSIHVDSRIYASLFGMIALALIYEIAKTPSFRKSLCLGVFCGLSYLTRTDHFLLLGVFPISFFLLRKNGQGFWRAVIAVGAGFCLVVLPWWIRNLQVFGAFIHPGNQKVFFCKMLNNTNFYYYHYPFDWSGLLSDGWGSLLYHRLIVKPWDHLVQMNHILGPVSISFLLYGAYRLRRSPFREALIPAVVAWVLLTLFYSVYTTVSFNLNSLGMQLVFLFVFVAEGMWGAIDGFVKSKRKSASVSIAALLFFFSFLPPPVSRDLGRLLLGRSQTWNNNLGEVVGQVGKWLQENVPEGTVLMTNRPWELHYSTEYLAVQVPYDDGIAPRGPGGPAKLFNAQKEKRLNTLIEVAERYRTEYLILFDPEWYAWEITDPRLIRVAQWENDFKKYAYEVQIFRISF